jgi:hypothetical protein
MLPGHWLQIRSLQEEASNKQGHLRRLEDDIAAKMTDTHALNRECDKATVSFAEQEHHLQEVAERLRVSSEQARAAREATQEAGGRVAAAEQALEAASLQALQSEQRLSERIESSKAAISAFFALKKQANAREWELGKARSSLQQALARQQEALAALESRNLVTGVQQAAEAQEASPASRPSRHWQYLATHHPRPYYNHAFV